MSTISAPRPSHKRPHISSPLNNQSDDLSFKRQKTVRTYTSTTSTSTNTSGRLHPLSSSSSSSPIISSEFSPSQPDSRGPPLPADFFDTTITSSPSTTTPTILPIGSQNRAPPPAPKGEPPTTTDIDEDEWAAFEADIAETEVTVSATTNITTIPSSAVISAAPTGPGEPTTTKDSEVREDEAALDREDAQNKLVEEFEEMESLESRVQKLKEQREVLRAKAAESVGGRMDVTINGGREDDDEDEDEDEEDDWIHFSR